MFNQLHALSTGLQRVAVVAIIGSAIASMATGTHAQNNPAVGDIVSRGKIVIGVQTEQPPWGYTETNGDLVGYDIDVAKALATQIGVPVEFESVTTNNRIAQLSSGKVDMLIAVVGMYAERAKVVQFSKPYATLEVNLIGKQSQKITGPDDLVGLTVGVARGAAQDTAVTPYEAKGVIVKRFEDQPQSMQALLSGQVDVISDNNTHNATLKRLSDPADPFESKFVFSRQYMGVATRLGETELAEYVNAFIDKIKADGTLQKISRKWLDADLPEFPATMEGIPY